MEEKDTENAVTLSEYNTEWPLLFNKEKDFLMKIIGRYIIGSIEHVGSTAVPGLAAKPVIDIMFGVKSLKYSKPVIELLVKKYVELKKALAKHYKEDREAYTESKTNFIQNVLNMK